MASEYTYEARQGQRDEVNRPYRSGDRYRARTEFRVERDRGRSRSRGSDPAPVNATRNLSRLAYAWGQANLQMYYGAAQVLGDFLIDVSETLFETSLFGRDTRGRSTRRVGVRREGDRFEARVEHVDDEDDDFDRTPRRGADRGRRRSDRVGDDLADSVTQALQDTADLISRSAERFTSAYDTEPDDDWDQDDDEPEEGYDRATEARQTRARREAQAAHEDAQAAKDREEIAHLKEEQVERSQDSSRETKRRRTTSTDIEKL